MKWLERKIAAWLESRGWIVWENAGEVRRRTLSRVYDDVPAGAWYVVNGREKP